MQQVMKKHLKFLDWNDVVHQLVAEYEKYLRQAYYSHDSYKNNFGLTFYLLVTKIVVFIYALIISTLFVDNLLNKFVKRINFIC